MANFWLTEPSNLAGLNLIPTAEMTMEERLNSLTRLIIIITLILFIVYYDQAYWWKFLLCRLFIILILYMSLGNKSYKKDITGEEREEREEEGEEYRYH